MDLVALAMTAPDVPAEMGRVALAEITARADQAATTAIGTMDLVGQAIMTGTGREAMTVQIVLTVSREAGDGRCAVTDIESVLIPIGCSIHAIEHHRKL